MLALVLMRMALVVVGGGGGGGGGAATGGEGTFGGRAGSSIFGAAACSVETADTVPVPVPAPGARPDAASYSSPMFVSTLARSPASRVAPARRLSTSAPVSPSSACTRSSSVAVARPTAATCAWACAIASARVFSASWAACARVLSALARASLSISLAASSAAATIACTWVPALAASESEPRPAAVRWSSSISLASARRCASTAAGSYPRRPIGKSRFSMLCLSRSTASED